MNPFPANHSRTIKLFHCCAPGCTTFDVAGKFLHFPTDCVWRQRWLSAMPTKNMVIDHSSMLCLKHFNPADVALFNNLLDDNKRTNMLGKCLTPLVREGACPVFFPKETDMRMNELQIASINNPMFEVHSRDYSPETFGELEGLDAADYIIDFICLKKFYPEKLKDHLQYWRSYIYNDHLLFYTMDCTFVPKIATGIKINGGLLLTVYLDGREMDLADLTWIVPLSGKINRWSQIQVLLKHFMNC